MENRNVSELKEPTEKEVAKITLPATPPQERHGPEHQDRCHCGHPQGPEHPLQAR